MGCEVDPLDKQPLDSLSPEVFFSTESGLQAYSNGFYLAFPASSLYCEQADVYATKEMPKEISGRVEVPATGGGWSWGTLRDINTLLGNLHYCKDQEVATHYEALAKFFRAYFYFDKVKQFGDVPWYDKELGSADADLYKARDSRELVMQNMLKDINFAINHLPTSKSVYEVTKWTALALKSRFCLFEGTFRKYHNITEYENGADYYLDLAINASLEFINSSGYRIDKEANNPAMNYRHLFSSLNATNGEVILARDYSAALDLVHNVGGAFNTPSNGCYGMTKKVAAAYLMADGSRFTDQKDWQTMNFMEETVGRDPRMAQSIITPTYIRDGEEATSAQNMSYTTTGYAPIKYLTTAEYNDYNKSEIDLIIFRAAEVYLNYAEAKAERGTLTQQDLDMSVNELRKRVGMPNLVMSVANANPDPFLMKPATGENLWGGFANVSGPNTGVILEIRRERLVELVQEGHRYYDIIRWKEGQIFTSPLYGIYIEPLEDDKRIYDFNGDGKDDYCVYQGNTKPKTDAMIVHKVGADVTLSNDTYGYIIMHKGMGKWNESRDYLKPIPSSERTLNHALTQNSGWNDGLDF